jgi:hypothetical protein
MSSDIADGTIQQVDMNTNAVATSTIQDGAVTAVKLASNSVDSGKIADGSIATADIGDSQVTALKIANRTRKQVISGGAFTSDSGVGSMPSGTPNFSASNFRNRLAAPRLENNTSNVATATFTVPSDYVAGQPFPQMTLYWATDSGTGSNQADMDVSFTNITSITAVTSDVTFRYNFRNGGGGGANDMQSLDPAQGAVVAQVVPEVGDSFAGAPSWNPGDVIVLSIGRNGASGSDPNDGNIYIVAVEFSYQSDQ